MPLPFDPVELAFLHGTGYFGIPEEKLEEIADEVRSGQSLFDACWACGIDPANLTREDGRAIRELLDWDEDDEEEED